MLPTEIQPVLAILLFAVAGFALGLVNLLAHRHKYLSWHIGVGLPVAFACIVAGCAWYTDSAMVLVAGNLPVIACILFYAANRWHIRLAAAVVYLSRQRLVHGALLIIGALAAIAFGVRRFEQAVECPDGLPPTPGFDAAQFVADVFTVGPAQAHAYSDRNAMLPLRTPDLPAELLAEVQAHESRLLAGFHDRVLRTGPIDGRYNCHGWVFTRGQGWLNSPEVAQILADNEYRQVEEPKPGDIVVYRNGPVIVHTGLVRLVDAGSVVVESKFSMCGRFLHAPLDQPYGNSFSYFRTTRHDHLIRGNWISTETPGISTGRRSS